MAKHLATIRWYASPGENYAKGQYSRAHSWTFDGGAIVPASASPHIVPMPWADPDAVDPEEAFVASAASCHMLFFLDFARQAGLVVTGYEDEAEGEMHKGSDGKAVRILGPTRIGAHGTPIFFLHPKDMGGVLTEIMESPKQAH